MREELSKSFRQSAKLLHEVVSNETHLLVLQLIALDFIRAFRTGNKLLICGNGGSAADAQHIAAELVGRFKTSRNPLPAIALSADTATITAIGNDFGFARVYARQIKALGQPNDILLGLSTSGRSPNIFAAFKAADDVGMRTFGFTGADHALGELAQLLFVVPSTDTALIQQVYMTAAHAICGVVEQALQQAEGHEVVQSA